MVTHEFGAISNSNGTSESADGQEFGAMHVSARWVNPGVFEVILEEIKTNVTIFYPASQQNSANKLSLFIAAIWESMFPLTVTQSDFSCRSPGGWLHPQHLERSEERRVAVGVSSESSSKISSACLACAMCSHFFPQRNKKTSQMTWRWHEISLCPLKWVGRIYQTGSWRILCLDSSHTFRIDSPNSRLTNGKK